MTFLTVVPAAPRDDGSPNPLGGALALVERRRRLRRVVASALAVCGAILLGAMAAQVSRGWTQGASSMSLNLRASSPAPAKAVGAADRGETDAPDPSGSSTDAPGIGTLHLRWPATAGQVWLDGARLSATSAVVDCGRHEVRVGVRGRPHPVEVPCGGDLSVTR